MTSSGEPAKNSSGETNGRRINKCCKALKNFLYLAENKKLSGTFFVAVPLESGRVGDFYTRLNPAPKTQGDARVADS